MRVTVSRSGGFAGLTRVWTTEVSDSQHDPLRTLIDSCPWEEVPREAPMPDRYVYVIEADQRRITLPETSLTRPWKMLVEKTRQADAARRSTGDEPGDPGEVS